MHTVAYAKISVSKISSLLTIHFLIEIRHFEGYSTVLTIHSLSYKHVYFLPYKNQFNETRPIQYNEITFVIFIDHRYVHRLLIFHKSH